MLQMWSNFNLIFTFGKVTDYSFPILMFVALIFAPVGVVRASNIFPILSAILLLMGGVCIAASRFYKRKRNIILGAGILFVAAGNW